MTDLPTLIQSCELCEYGVVDGSGRRVEMRHGPTIFICHDCVSRVHYANEVTVLDGQIASETVRFGGMSQG